MPYNIGKIVIVGAGKMAKAYAQVMIASNNQFIIVGRSEARVKQLRKEFPIVESLSGGIEAYLLVNDPPEIAVVATNITTMAPIAEKLIDAGTKRILLEKPGALSIGPLKDLLRLIEKKPTSIFIGYNRRFYKSVAMARQIIEEDGGATSMHFEFTEMIYKIKPEKHGKEALEKWIIANSSHVIDTAFFLTGSPARIDAKVYGKEVNWHPSGSIFMGCGMTKKFVPFTYCANWGSAGRWNIEIMTKAHRLIFSPMERLKIQKKGETLIEGIKTDYTLDEKFKPGIYLQTMALLNGEGEEKLLTLEEQINNINRYNVIGNYRSCLKMIYRKSV